MSPYLLRLPVRFRLIILATLCLPLTASATIGEMLHKSYRDRNVIFSKRYLPLVAIKPPAERLKTIDAWIAEARNAHDPGAEMELRLARIKLREEIGTIGVDEKIALQSEMLKSLDQRKFPEYAMRLMYDIGNTQFRPKRNFTLAFEQFINAYELSQTVSSEDFPDKKHIVVTIGNRYYSLGDLDRSRSILLEADTMKWDSPRINKYNIRNTLGLICRSQGHYDSAIMYFETARHLALEDSSMLWAAIAQGNIGICHYLMGNYPAAVPLLEEDIATCLQPLSLAEDNGVNSLLILGDIHHRLGNTDQLSSDLRKARAWLPKCRDQIRPRSLLFTLEAKYFASRGEFRQAYAAQDSASYYRDSILARENIFKVARMEHERDMASQRSRLRQVDAERRLAIFTRNSLLGGIGLLGIIVFLGVSRQRLRNRERHRILIRDREKAEAELRTAEDKLAAFTRRLQEKNALIERSAEQIAKLENKIADSQNADVKHEVLQQLYNSTILTDDEWSSFKLLFEQVHRGYLQHLKDVLPELTPADTRFLVLSKLRLSSKEMAAILGVAPDTIRSYRHRLKKRLDQLEDPGIRELLSGL